MKSKLILSFLIILSSYFSNAQFEVGIGVGISLPVTGYKEVLKSGWLLNAQGKYRFGFGNFALGLKAQVVRLQKDKNPNDAFHDARMTVAPLLFTAEYGTSIGKLQPYIEGGLGITFFNFHYETSPTEGKSINNVSFTMMPLAGVRYAASKNVFPFIESGYVLLADGPPMGFPKGGKMTGYNAVVTGLSYRF